MILGLDRKYVSMEHTVLLQNLQNEAFRRGKTGDITLQGPRRQPGTPSTDIAKKWITMWDYDPGAKQHFRRTPPITM